MWVKADTGGMGIITANMAVSMIDAFHQLAY
jgi:hypothetical protein